MICGSCRTCVSLPIQDASPWPAPLKRMNVLAHLKIQTNSYHHHYHYRPSMSLHSSFVQRKSGVRTHVIRSPSRLDKTNVGSRGCRIASQGPIWDHAILLLASRASSIESWSAICFDGRVRDVRSSFVVVAYLFNAGVGASVQT